MSYFVFSHTTSTQVRSVPVEDTHAVESNSQLVKAYTKLMMTSEPEISMMMALVPIGNCTTDLTTIATAIRDWCLQGVKPLEESIFPTSASVEECVENQLTITDVGDSDTCETLVTAFHKAVRWNSPVK